MYEDVFSGVRSMEFFEDNFFREIERRFEGKKKLI